MTFYPNNPTELAAVMAAFVPLAIWAASSMLQALTEANKRAEAEWARLHELADVLNKGVDHGHWRQILAVKELERLRTRRAEAKALASMGAEFYRAIDKRNTQLDELVAELDAFQAKIEVPIEVRWMAILSAFVALVTLIFTIVAAVQGW